MRRPSCKRDAPAVVIQRIKLKSDIKADGYSCSHYEKFWLKNGLLKS